MMSNIDLQSRFVYHFSSWWTSWNYWGTPSLWDATEWSSLSRLRYPPYPWNPWNWTTTTHIPLEVPACRWIVLLKRWPLCEWTRCEGWVAIWSPSPRCAAFWSFLFFGWFWSYWPADLSTDPWHPTWGPRWPQIISDRNMNDSILLCPPWCVASRPRPDRDYPWATPWWPSLDGILPLSFVCATESSNCLSSN